MLKTLSAILFISASWLNASHSIAACKQSVATEADFPDSVVAAIDAPNNTNVNYIVKAWYDGATDRYSHGVLGDAIEPSTLVISGSTGCSIAIELSDEHVFEDIAPRLANIDDKPGVEVITVRSHQQYGAQIAVYQLQNNALEILATTPYIGTANRWLAPVGIADFDNDNHMDIAYVDRPHLAKILRVWSYRDGKLEQTAHNNGYSNHRIGEDFISGGIKQCGNVTSMITADTHWQRILETRLINNQLVSKDIGEFDGATSFVKARQCE